MRNILKISIITTLLITTFIGCGGGSGDGDASFSNPETVITLQPCDTYEIFLQVM